MWDKQLDSLEVSYATLMTAMEEGFEKGREENQITSARNFLKSGFPADVIAENLNRNRPITRYLSTHSFLRYTVIKNKLEDLLCLSPSSH
ncbi:hypothetical protein K6V35_10620 [Streptococcus suis]|nr:hypothetical protein [Streptococcus suis]MBY5040001.1 hypothetical protein [Streptococcus suis]